MHKKNLSIKKLLLGNPLKTFIGMIIVLWTKFTGGAWMLIIAIPTLTLIMSKIKKHYDFIAEQLKVNVATIIVPYLYKIK